MAHLFVTRSVLRERRAARSASVLRSEDLAKASRAEIRERFTRYRYPVSATAKSDASVNGPARTSPLRFQPCRCRRSGPPLRGHPDPQETRTAPMRLAAHATHVVGGMQAAGCELTEGGALQTLAGHDA